jgi:uncharacterized protein YprB with RNaseH-like and TPR domain
MGRRRLFFDIETSPNIGLFWQAGYKQRIDHDNIIEERRIICICYKWEGEDKVFSLNWNAKQDDKKMISDFIKVANHADELVGHNGDKFDLPWIRTRCLFHGLEMFPKYATIDTLKVSRQQFRFNSNRLNYIAQYLGLGQKLHTEFGLWKKVLLDKDKEALGYMVEYCKEDVKLLERVYEKLSTHTYAKAHYGVIHGQDRGSCKECGSDELIKQRIRVNASGSRTIIYKCNTCGKYNTKIDK